MFLCLPVWLVATCTWPLSTTSPSVCPSTLSSSFTLPHVNYWSHTILCSSSLWSSQSSFCPSGKVKASLAWLHIFRQSICGVSCKTHLPGFIRMVQGCFWPFWRSVGPFLRSAWWTFPWARGPSLPVTRTSSSALRCSLLLWLFAMRLPTRSTWIKGWTRMVCSYLYMSVYWWVFRFWNMQQIL